MGNKGKICCSGLLNKSVTQARNKLDSFLTHRLPPPPNSAETKSQDEHQVSIHKFTISKILLR